MLYILLFNTLFQQHNRRLHTWTSPDDQHRNQTDYILCNQRWTVSIQSTKMRPGAACGSDHELLIATFRLKLKKVGKTTRPFRYDLNQIAYDYTVEVRNRFKGLDLIDRVPDWFQIRKGVHQGCILSPCLFNLYAEYIMRNAGLEVAQAAAIKIAVRNINNLRYADDTTLMQKVKRT